MTLYIVRFKHNLLRVNIFKLLISNLKLFTIKKSQFLSIIQGQTACFSVLTCKSLLIIIKNCFANKMN